MTMQGSINPTFAILFSGSVLFWILFIEVVQIQNSLNQPSNDYGNFFAMVTPTESSSATQGWLADAPTLGKVRELYALGPSGEGLGFTDTYE